MRNNLAFTHRARAGMAALVFVFSATVCAQEAQIRKNLAERLPQLPKIEEVQKTPVAGIYEVRLNGNEIVYSDEQGNHLIQGQLLDTRSKRNLTEERTDKLNMIEFASLPKGDAFTLVRGKGERKVVVFEDPNCGYCKRFEKELAKVDNLTAYIFLYPILGADSMEKSKRIWCSKDKAKAWTDWMLNNKAPAALAAAPTPTPACDTKAIERNVEIGKKWRVTGTPTLVFVNGQRVPGAIEAADIEKMLASSK